MSFDKDNWAVPAGLSRKARKLALALAKLAKERNWNAGQKVFWSPKEWRNKGEHYGLNAELVILHEGGDHAPFFSLDYCSWYKDGRYDQYDEQCKFLREYGFWLEGLYTWSSAVYES
jgi:hypothetical protein